ncbi:MAG TPA: alpha-galactosidase [Actinomycetota bacterium]|nr:alpha-galactosidase [Actinomycetota bacterium]
MIRRAVSLALAALVIAAVAPVAHAADAARYSSGSTYATVTDDGIVAGNAMIERTWDRAAFATTALVDKRQATVTAGSAQDFSIQVGKVWVPSTAFAATGVTVTDIGNGLRLSIELVGPGIDATRVVEVYDGIAGMRTQTILNPLGPLVIAGATLDNAAVGSDVAATVNAFRAGADWRDPDWSGPPFSLGDAHGGTWRASTSGDVGESVSAPGEWISSRSGDASLFMVMERNDFPSSRASYDGATESLVVDLARDVISLGPLEEDGHIENPTDAPARNRALVPGQAFSLPASFTGFGASTGDEPWQFYKYLTERRLAPYDHDVTFNSNGTDNNAISTGAKDDMNLDMVNTVAPKAKRLGVDTFILDDGWQAISGDWFPDCPDHPEPRWDGDPNSKFRPRFPDCNFDAVRQAIAPMKLGLWMNPMHFNFHSEIYAAHPEWACAPVGHALSAADRLQEGSGSSEAGLGTWGPDAIPWVESRIRNAIENWGVRYFKFDFLVWLDCAGQGDMYDYHDRFVAMLDRLRADHPAVTFQIDETNDYRLFPFDSVTRGPSWFQNGSPDYGHLLHNLWNLSPFIPTFSLGQHFLGNGSDVAKVPTGTLMAAAFPSHMTFFSDLRKLPDEVVDRAAPWIDFYKTYRSELGGMAYPLLADPLEDGWTALQTWDPEAGRGALLAFRQSSPDATKQISLANVPAGRTFDLIEAPTGTVVGTATSAELSAGIQVSIPQADGAEVLVVVPHTDSFDPSTTLTYSGDVTARVGGTATLAATLTGSDGPVSGATVTITFRGTTFTATTDPRGVASVQSKTPGPPGTYEVTASFAGTDRYSPSTTSATVTLGSRTAG